MITVTTNVHFTTTKAGRKRIHAAPGLKLATPPPSRIPRISQLMALAIKFDRLLREGKVADQSELAHVTQPRMTQIMNLNHLAPDIQEELLFLPPLQGGRESIHERMLRVIAALLDWAEQRKRWRSARPGSPAAP